MLFMSLAVFYQNAFFRITLECRTNWIQIRVEMVFGLNWVQTARKGYQDKRHIATSG